MSLSDIEQEGFKPIDLTSLDTFDGEIEGKVGDPDFDRFKLLFDPFELAGDEPVSFQALFSFEKQAKEEPFEPLVKARKTRLDPPGAGPADESGAEGQKEEAVEERSPEELAIEQGYQDGFQQGLAKGEEEGFKKGEAQGFAKGEEEGFKKGEAEGFAKGEPEGFAQGEKQGIEAGEQQTREQAEKILDTLKESLKGVNDLLDNLVDKHEEQILGLVFKIAEKAVLASVDSNDEVVRLTILDALKSLARPEEIVLSISPEDYEYVEMIKDSFFIEVESLTQVAVQSDPLVSRGGCRIETSTGSVSTDPETKLKAVYDALIQSGKPM